MGKAIDKGPAKYRNKRFIQFHGKDPGYGNSRPTEQGAEENQEDPGNNLQRGLFLKRREIRLILDGCADKVNGGYFYDNLFKL